MSAERDILTQRFILNGPETEATERYDLVDMLLKQDGGFNIETTNSTRDENTRPRIAYRFKPTRGMKEFPRLGNDTLSGDNPEGEPLVNGLFRIDRENERILYQPGGIISAKDTYRAWDLGLVYSGSLVDMVTVLTDRGLPLMQVTLVERVPFFTLNRETDREKMFTQSMRAIPSARNRFGESGYHEREAYQVEGELSVQQILAGELHPVQPIPDNLEEYLDKLKKDWGRQVE